MGTREEEASRYQKQGRRYQGGLGNSTGEGARWLYRVCAGPKASDTNEGRGWGGGGGEKSGKCVGRMKCLCQFGVKTWAIVKSVEAEQ